jgi:hypothetical protein
MPDRSKRTPGRHRTRKYLPRCTASRHPYLHRRSRLAARRVANALRRRATRLRSRRAGRVAGAVALVESPAADLCGAAPATAASTRAAAVGAIHAARVTGATDLRAPVRAQGAARRGGIREAVDGGGSRAVAASAASAGASPAASAGTTARRVAGGDRAAGVARRGTDRTVASAAAGVARREALLVVAAGVAAGARPAPARDAGARVGATARLGEQERRKGRRRGEPQGLPPTSCHRYFSVAAAATRRRRDMTIAGWHAVAARSRADPAAE